MGHAVMYETYPVTWTIQHITADVGDYIQQNGDGYGSDKVRFPTEKIFDTRQDAEEYIRSADNGWYDGVAVKFLDYSDVKDSKKVEELRKKIAETVNKKGDYIKAHSVKTQKAAYIGCHSCGSKLNKEKLIGEYCPLCNTDLRAASTLERIRAFQDRVEEYDKKITEERKKEKKKAKVKWLVKFEYHC